MKKNHVTLKTGVMMEDSALITGIHVINAITVFLSNKNDKRSTIGFFQKHL